jgi:O-antigen/teichoic acid export membrane protein
MPGCVLIALFSADILRLWIDSDFSNHAAEILTLLACGMLINSISLIPYTWLQATNNSKIVAVIHLSELPLFGAILWLCLAWLGLKGAAFAWVARIVLDAVLLWSVTAFVNRDLAPQAIRCLAQSLIFALSIYVLCMTGLSPQSKLAALVVIVVYCGARVAGIAREAKELVPA